MKKISADLAVLIAVTFWIFCAVSLIVDLDFGDLPMTTKIIGLLFAVFGVSVPFILWAMSMSDISERKEESSEKWYWYFQVFGIALGPFYYWKYLRPKIR